MNTERTCCHRWWASRIEVDTAPVEHVCVSATGHEGPCACSCGAVRLERRDG